MITWELSTKPRQEDASATRLWHWRRIEADGTNSESANAFSTVFDCARDAQRHGYRAEDGRNRLRIVGDRLQLTRCTIRET